MRIVLNIFLTVCINLIVIGVEIAAGIELELTARLLIVVPAVVIILMLVEHTSGNK